MLSLRIADDEVDKSVSSVSLSLGWVYNEVDFSQALCFPKPKELDCNLQDWLVGIGE